MSLILWSQMHLDVNHIFENLILHSSTSTLCVWRCTTRKNLNNGVTWSISLNLWSICIYASKTKSICEPFFDWIKITDFFIVKLTIFWEWKMTPKNSQFCYKKICNFDPIKKGLLEWFWFSIFCHPKTFMNMVSHQFSQVRAVCTTAY